MQGYNNYENPYSARLENQAMLDYVMQHHHGASALRKASDQYVEKMPFGRVLQNDLILALASRGHLAHGNPYAAASHINSAGRAAGISFSGQTSFGGGPASVHASRVLAQGAHNVMYGATGPGGVYNYGATGGRNYTEMMELASIGARAGLFAGVSVRKHTPRKTLMDQYDSEKQAYQRDLDNKMAELRASGGLDKKAARIINEYRDRIERGKDSDAAGIFTQMSGVLQRAGFADIANTLYNENYSAFNLAGADKKIARKLKKLGDTLNIVKNIDKSLNDTQALSMIEQFTGMSGSSEANINMMRSVASRMASNLALHGDPSLDGNILLTTYQRAFSRLRTGQALAAGTGLDAGNETLMAAIDGFVQSSWLSGKEGAVSMFNKIKYGDDGPFSNRISPEIGHLANQHERDQRHLIAENKVVLGALYLAGGDNVTKEQRDRLNQLITGVENAEDSPGRNAARRKLESYMRSNLGVNNMEQQLSNYFKTAGSHRLRGEDFLDRVTTKATLGLHGFREARRARYSNADAMMLGGIMEAIGADGLKKIADEGFEILDETRIQHLSVEQLRFLNELDGDVEARKKIGRLADDVNTFSSATLSNYEREEAAKQILNQQAAAMAGVAKLPGEGGFLSGLLGLKESFTGDAEILAGVASLNRHTASENLLSLYRNNQEMPARIKSADQTIKKALEDPDSPIREFLEKAGIKGVGSAEELRNLQNQLAASGFTVASGLVALDDSVIEKHRDLLPSLRAAAAARDLFKGNAPDQKLFTGDEQDLYELFDKHGSFDFGYAVRQGFNRFRNRKRVNQLLGNLGEMDPEQLQDLNNRSGGGVFSELSRLHKDNLGHLENVRGREDSEKIARYERRINVLEGLLEKLDASGGESRVGKMVVEFADFRKIKQGEDS